MKFKLNEKELASWNIDMKRTVEAGELADSVAPHAQGGQAAKMMM